MDLSNVFKIEETTIDPEEKKEINSIYRINNENRKSISPKGLIGYYIVLLKNFFNENQKQVEIKPFFQEDFIPNDSTPVIYINRGTISPYVLSAPGNAYQNTQGIELIGLDEVNENESKAGEFFLSQQMTIRIFSSNRAELETLAYEVYKLLLAVSDDILNKIFDDVVYVQIPTMSQISAVPKSSDYYFIEIDWEIVFKECNILIFKEKLLKYTRLIIHEKDSEDIL